MTKQPSDRNQKAERKILSVSKKDVNKKQIWPSPLCNKTIKSGLISQVY
ncbi:MAG TPA: hypothetical protein VJ836_01240 [Candidatus Saccharimonadales bacterium]|nr:hypothetical protein [Candidatus Saccharimonadales bacterium]